MRIPKRGEKGFTLIELLIVVAILGVLAAVIIPNVSRFFGAGETEARKTEKANVQLAMDSMMLDNGINAIPNMDFVETGGPSATNDMGAFPDGTSNYAPDGGKETAPNGEAYTLLDAPGYLLWGHDITADELATPVTNYMRQKDTVYYYTCDADGTVHQYENDDATGDPLDEPSA